MFAGFPEPKLSSEDEICADLHGKTPSEQQLETQPMLQPIPWEPHFSDLHAFLAAQPR